LTNAANVPYWHLADIDADAEHVRFRGQSGPSLIGWPMSA